MKLSAVILTKNEEKSIRNAIDSVSFCDEIIVIDDGSIDATVQIAKNSGATVISHALSMDFAKQRNWAMQQAKNEWILFLDADEVISVELKKELLSCDFQSSSYHISRRDFFWNTELRYGETHKCRTEGIIRLVKKGSGTWKGMIHEEYFPTQSSGKLHGYINHYSHENLASFITDINMYSTMRAEELAKKGKRVSAIELIVFPFGKFIYTYFLLGGFLDGPAGFVYSFVMSFHSFLVRAKLVTQSYV